MLRAPQEYIVLEDDSNNFGWDGDIDRVVENQ